MRNGDLAELLARAAEGEEGHRARALRRAGRAALLWTEEAVDLLEAGRPLTELRAVGPWVARVIEGLVESPPPVPDPPETRRGFLTMTEARAILDDHPDWRPQLRADLQMHTTWSDGTVPLDEMVRLAAGQGHEFVAVTDHSVGLPIAKGMDEPTLRRQMEAIEDLNQVLAGEGVGIRALRSLEMNLSPEGDGDMDPALLGELDLVLGAFHSRLRVTEDQTDRYLAAIRNPSVNVLAHPRGRRWNARPGLRADWEVVMQEAARSGTALEIDAFPDRQDLQVELVELAREAGAWISIGTDAHRPGELLNIDLGVAAAIRAGVPRDRILNYLPLEELMAWAAD
jgi:histidinol phosphatase-like PHP family hydrolase